MFFTSVKIFDLKLIEDKPQTCYGFDYEISRIKGSISLFGPSGSAVFLAFHSCGASALRRPVRSRSSQLNRGSCINSFQQSSGQRHSLHLCFNICFLNITVLCSEGTDFVHFNFNFLTIRKKNFNYIAVYIRGLSLKVINFSFLLNRVQI